MTALPEITTRMRDLVSWRRTLHAYPELAFQEHRTSTFVADRLLEFGCDEVLSGIGQTGVVGVIEGKGPGPSVGLRADMDALPVGEALDLPYASRLNGQMHACGHDGHTAMLLGAARSLATRRDFPGRVILIFQPAEETGAGTLAMLEDGLLERYPFSRVFALHNWPGLPEGRFHARPGPVMAAVADLTIRITGRGTHAALPHLGSDAVLAAAHVITALQAVVSRGLSPHEAAVVSIGHIEDKGSWNVIPGSVTLRGTARWFDNAVGERLRLRVMEIAQGIATGCGAQAEVSFRRVGPPVLNDATATAIALSVAAELGGPEAAGPLPEPVMGGDDIAWLLEKVPGCYLMLGAGGDENAPPLHHPRYAFNEALLPLGAAFLAAVARRALEA